MSEHPAADFIARRAWQPAIVEVDGEDTDVCFFDWFALDDQQRTDFTTYFAADRTDAIAAGTWLPIAVLGIGSAPASFAEADNRGFLALLVDDGTVVHSTDGAQIAASIDELDTQIDLELDTE